MSQVTKQLYAEEWEIKSSSLGYSPLFLNISKCCSSVLKRPVGSPESTLFAGFPQNVQNSYVGRHIVYLRDVFTIRKPIVMRRLLIFENIERLIVFNILAMIFYAVLCRLLQTYKD